MNARRAVAERAERANTREQVRAKILQISNDSDADSVVPSADCGVNHRFMDKGGIRFLARDALCFQ